MYTIELECILNGLTWQRLMLQVYYQMMMGETVK